MKHIKTVENLLIRAENKGESHVTRDGRVIYEAGKYGDDEHLMGLYHYNRRIAEFDLNKHRLVALYGESVSDVDAISTFFERYGVPFMVGYRPVNGGFYGRDVDGTEIFRGDYDSDEEFADSLYTPAVMDIEFDRTY